MKKRLNHHKSMIGENMFDVTALGELLIDFTSCRKDEAEMQLFEQNPGGAPGNVLTALSRCGLSTAMIGKVGRDLHGSFLKETLENNYICTDGLVMDDSVFTTLAFVTLQENGERTFSFARKPGADMMLQKEEISTDIIENSRIFHMGSLSLTDEPVKSATWYALDRAIRSGCVISYDPNYRPALWKSEDIAINEMRRVLPYINLMKLSDEETELLTGIEDPMKAAEKLVDQGISVVTVTLGAQGAIVCNREGAKLIRGFESHVVDTTGAGDSFWGGFLYCYIQSGKKPDEITLDEAAEFTCFANAMASLCVEKRGGMPSIPHRKMVEERAQAFQS